MKKIRNIVTVAWLGVVVSILYIAMLVSNGDPRIEDGDLTVFEMNILESSVFIFSWFTMFIFWFYTLYKAYEIREFGWLVFTFILFPIYPISLWKIESELRD